MKYITSPRCESSGVHVRKPTVLIITRLGSKTETNDPQKFLPESTENLATVSLQLLRQ